MHVMKSLGLTAVILAGACGAASAGVLVGAAGSSPSGFPFGANPGGRYQQVFDSSLLSGGGPVNVTSLTFFSADTAPLATGPYTIALSTTARGVDGLEDIGSPVANTLAQAANSNLGGDNTVVFNGALPGVSDGRLTFSFAGFRYDPSAGNLLLDVSSAASGTASAFFAFDDSGVTLTSRLISNGGTGFVAEPFGLVTEIGVPEPASMALLGVGIAGAVALRRRRSA